MHSWLPGPGKLQILPYLQKHAGSKLTRSSVIRGGHKDMKGQQRVLIPIKAHSDPSRRRGGYDLSHTKPQT
jgi:hypothetical protein